MIKSLKLKIKKQEFDFNAEEISELNRDINMNIIENYSQLENKPFREIHRNNVKFNVLYDPDRINFWKKYEVNKWENETIEIIERYISNETYFIDIGAWIGPITLYASKFASKVIAFEPDPVAFSILKKNVDLNKNSEFYEKINLNQIAVTSKEEGSINIYSSELGGSGTSIILDNKFEKVLVDSISLSNVFKKFNLNNEKLLIKIDVEGYEYELLKNNLDLIKNLNCNLYFSLHPKNLIKQIYGNHKNKLNGIFFYIMIYIKLIRKLPFKFILVNSKKISISKLILKSILYGIPDEVHIFCTNKIIK